MNVTKLPQYMVMVVLVALGSSNALASQGCIYSLTNVANEELKKHKFRRNVKINSFNMDLCKGKLDLRGRGKGKLGRHYRIYLDADVNVHKGCIVELDNIELDIEMPVLLYVAQFVLTLNLKSILIDYIEYQFEEKIIKPLPRTLATTWLGATDC